LRKDDSAIPGWKTGFFEESSGPRLLEQKLAVLVEASRLSPARNAEPFEAAAVNYLLNSLPSGASKKQAARQRD
jgi:hypothetical protein